jgi:rod shape-determining protein MreD
MKYLWYFILLYVLLPFNLYVDLISILVFYLVFHEDERFTLIFSFIAGLLIDLFYPVVLGVNIIIYIVLVQIMLYIKKYIVHSIWVSWIVFTAYYLVKTIATYLAFSAPFRVLCIFLTILSFLPFILILNKLKYRVWMKI